MSFCSDRGSRNVLARKSCIHEFGLLLKERLSAGSEVGGVGCVWWAKIFLTGFGLYSYCMSVL